MKSKPVILPALTLALGACSPEPEAQPPPITNAVRAARIATIQARIDATNRRDFQAWMELHTEGACRTAPELEGPLCGREAMRGAIEVLSTAFPDYHLELVQVVAEGDWMAVRIHTQGTMTGPLLLSNGVEVPPTGRTIDQEWTALVQFEGQRIARFDEYYDQHTLMVQLGLAQ